ncbi:hypothetical protein HDU84_004056 [Entophlyctis sp. JEL0112]|nr:hypothetical protein HDU84_004056 [Entophlyctis sp. JEL0112]
MRRLHQKILEKGDAKTQNRGRDYESDNELENARSKEHRLAKLLDEEKRNAAAQAKERWEAEKRIQKRMEVMKAKLDEKSQELSACLQKEKSLKDMVARLQAENSKLSKKLSSSSSIQSVEVAAVHQQYNKHEQRNSDSTGTTYSSSFNRESSTSATTSRPSNTTTLTSQDSDIDLFFDPDDIDITPEESAVRRRLLKTLQDSQYWRKLVEDLETECDHLRRLAEVDRMREIKQLQREVDRLRSQADSSDSDSSDRTTTQDSDSDHQSSSSGRSRRRMRHDPRNRSKSATREAANRDGLDATARRGEKSKNSVPVLEARIQDLLKRIQTAEDEKLAVEQTLLETKFEKERALADVARAERKISAAEETLQTHIELQKARTARRAENEIPGLNITYTQLRTSTSRLLANKSKEELAVVIDHLSGAAEKLKLELDHFKKSSNTTVSNLKYMEMLKENKVLKKEKAEAIEMAKAKAICEIQTEKVEEENNKLRGQIKRESEKCKKLVERIKELENIPTKKIARDSNESRLFEEEMRREIEANEDMITRLRENLREKEDIIKTLSESVPKKGESSPQMRKLQREVEMWKAQYNQLKRQFTENSMEHGDVAEVQAGLGEVVVERNMLREKVIALESQVQELKSELSQFDGAFIAELEELKTKYRDTLKANIRYEEQIRRMRQCADGVRRRFKMVAWKPLQALRRGASLWQQPQTERTQQPQPPQAAQSAQPSDTRALPPAASPGLDGGCDPRRKQRPTTSLAAMWSIQRERIGAWKSSVVGAASSAANQENSSPLRRRATTAAANKPTKPTPIATERLLMRFSTTISRPTRPFTSTLTPLSPLSAQDEDREKLDTGFTTPTLQRLETAKTRKTSTLASRRSLRPIYSIQKAKILFVGVADALVFDFSWFGKQAPHFDAFMRDFPDAECHLVINAINEPFLDFLKTRFVSVSLANNFEHLPYGVSEFDMVCHEWDGTASNALIDELMRVTKSNSHIELIRGIEEDYIPAEASMFYLEDDDESESEAVDLLRLYSKAILNLVTRRVIAHDNQRKAEYESIHFQVDKNINNPDFRFVLAMAPTATAVTAVSSASRLSALRAVMKAQQLHAFVIPSGDAHQSEYIAECDARRAFISGFTGSAGLAVVTLNEAALWTDGRYFVQAELQLDARHWILHKADAPTLEAWLPSVLSQNTYGDSSDTGSSGNAGATVGIDPTLISVSAAHTLADALRSADPPHALRAITENPVDAVWGADRPPRPANRVDILEVEFAGRPFVEKIADLRAELLKASGVWGFVVTALDEIAWLFNLRGSDIMCNPVFFSYALITANEVILYIDSARLSGEAKAQLASAAVDIRPYDDIFADLSDFTRLNSPKKLWAAPSCSLAISNAVSGNDGSTIGTKPNPHLKLAASPIASLKAIKNSVEIEGFRSCHIRDGAALVRYFSWLERQLADPSVEISECDGADKLESIRAKNQYFAGLSFDTISASGPNGAIVHYKPEPPTARRLTQNEIYLCDSGAQYKDGTTDVTRTLYFGGSALSAHEKSAYTRVLKGHIQTALCVFPRGTTGYVLDCIARLALWRVGLNYRHGTGHGVGHFLNVHEGPHGIGPRIAYNDTPLEPGMIVTNEPGFYEDGAFGIRIENVMVVKDVTSEIENNFGGKGWLGFESLTVAPISTKLVDLSLLTEEERIWLNRYHEDVHAKLAPLLQSPDDADALNWLFKETRPI